MNPKVSIVIPVFNEEKYLSDCLTSLENLEYPDDQYEIIVIDNGSTDTSVSIARSHTELVFVHSDVNVGGVRNYGVNKARGDVIVFIDSDCTVNSNWLSDGLDLLSQSKNNILGGCLLLRDNPNWVERLWVLSSASDDVKQTHLLGSSIFLRKNDFLALGGFDETVTSGEDSEFSERAKKSGYKVEIHKSLAVVHLGNPTTLSYFFTRQMWHAENYIKKLRDSLRDPVFWLVVIFSIGMCLLISTVLGMYVSLWLIFIALCGPTLLLSLKRIVRSSFKPTSINDVIGIFALDFLYLSGRSMGIVKSISCRLLASITLSKQSKNV